MKPLITITDQNIDPAATVKSPNNYRLRTAARAVVYDEAYKIALLHVANHGYYKLPGGGIDKGEAIQDGLQRELFEEIGCPAEIGMEICITNEQRDKFQMLQTSHCFLAVKDGELREPDMTDEEVERGFHAVWVTNIDEAIEKVEQSEPTTYEGKFIRLRDLAILKVAKAVTVSC